MNMKIKDLLANREKLARYDELKEWKERFEQPPKSTIDYVYSVMHVEGGVMKFANDTYTLPEHIKKIIVDALEAEIQKLDEE